MNSDTQPVNTSKYETLGKGPKTQINRCNNSDNPQMTDTSQIFNNLNQSTERKQKPDSGLTSHTLPSSAKHTNVITSKYQTHKLVDSKQVLGPFHQFDKKAFLLDTYARIVASNNRRCPKRLRELAKPKRQVRNDLVDHDANFYHGHVTKTYRAEDKCNLKEFKKK